MVIKVDLEEREVFVAIHAPIYQTSLRERERYIGTYDTFSHKCTLY